MGHMLKVTHVVAERSLMSKSALLINQSNNFYSGLSSSATARTTMGVTAVKKCHMIMSANDC